MTDFVQAECEIRQLYARCADAVWRKDATAFSNCFTQACEWKIAGLHFHGREEILSTFDRLLGTSQRVHVINGTPILEFDGDTGTGRIQVTELSKLNEGSSALTIGVYYDKYAKEDGSWRFQWRHFSLHYRGPIDMSADLVESPDYGPFPGMPAADEPTLTKFKG